MLRPCAHTCANTRPRAEPIRVTSALPGADSGTHSEFPADDDEGACTGVVGYPGGGPTDRWQGSEEHRGPRERSL